MRLTTKGLLLIAIPAVFELALLSGLVKAQSDAAQAERWAIHSQDVLRQTTAILDPVLGESVALRGAVLANDAPYPYPGGDPVNEESGKVMKFIISDEYEADTWTIPKKLINYPSADVLNAVLTRSISMYEYVSDSDEPTHLYVNGLPYDAPVTETPKAGTTEVLLINLYIPLKNVVRKLFHKILSSNKNYKLQKLN